MELPDTLRDFAEQAAAVLPAGPLGYYAGGAADEITLADNERAWRRIALRPRMLTGVAERDPGVTLLGRPQPHPLVVAPMAFQGLAHTEGEVAMARGAAAVQAPYCLSTLATTGVAELATAVPEGQRWFQLYVFTDRGIGRDLVAAAVDSGYDALVVTVDLPVFGRRERDVRSRFVVPDATTVSGARGTGVHGPLSPAGFGALIDAALSWQDIERFAASSPLPVVVKGILTPEDARLAVDHGAAAVGVSNHGGRQLDTVLAAADALPAVLEEVGGEVDVLVDGGIRRGTDVVKALALGATAVMVGRPLLWGLAVGGAEGVRRVFEILLEELDIALALTGVPRARDLDGRILLPAPWATQR